MTAYNIVNANRLIGGQPEDVADVLANLQAIQAVLNGGIDDTNINATAGIQKSKLGALGIVNADVASAAAIAYSKLALTNSLVNADVAAAAAIAYSKLNLAGALVNADINAAAAIVLSKLAITGAPTGSKFLRDDSTWALPAVSTTYRKTTVKDVVNTAAETDLLNGEITIGAGVMSTTGVLRVVMTGDYLFNNSQPNTAVLKLKIGSTVIYQTTLVGGSISATRGPWVWEFRVFQLGSNTTQFLCGAGTHTLTGTNTITQTVGISYAAPSLFTSSGTYVSPDMSGAQALTATITWSAASVNNSYRLQAALVQVL